MALSAGHKARAASIAKALGGRKAGNGWTARCPAHDDRTPSLSIRDADDNKVLVRCHAGCDQERVISGCDRAACGSRTPRAQRRS
jgi:putative DNA primase/helicase